MELGCATPNSPQHVTVFTNPEALKPCSLGIFVEASSHRGDQLLTHLQPLSPSLRMGDGVDSSKLLIMVGSFSLPGDQPPEAIQKPTQSHLIRKRCSCSPGNSRDLGALCQEQGQRPNIKTKDVLHHSGDYKDFRNSVSGTGGKDQINISYYVTRGHSWFCNQDSHIRLCSYLKGSGTGNHIFASHRVHNSHAETQASF